MFPLSWIIGPTGFSTSSWTQTRVNHTMAKLHLDWHQHMLAWRCTTTGSLRTPRSATQRCGH